MKTPKCTSGIVLAVMAGLVLAACAPRYYGDRGYYRDGYYAPRGHIEYTDRYPYNDPYYQDDSYGRQYRDYRGRY
ncbi:MAG TPA: hypothetical protein VGM26_15175 [Rhizomicrobium sp.]